MQEGNKISVVIICKNAASTIERAINTSLLVTDDVVVVDSGSTDGTIEMVTNTKARFKQVTWKGYGDAKNVGNEIALNDWIFSLDADEYLDSELIQSLRSVSLSDPEAVFEVQRLNYLGGKPIHHGAWSKDFVTRLFNRNNVRWDTSAVHEKLVINKVTKIERLKGLLHHYTSPGVEAYKTKLEKYAELMAEKYYSKRKKANVLKLYVSPGVNFLQNYIFKAGFLDGKEGLHLALADAGYTYKKYRLLNKKYK